MQKTTTNPLSGSEKDTLLVLGASTYQLDVIHAANAAGFRVVTLDHTPENPGHLLADQCYGISTTDTDEVLRVARREKIRGILAPCSDAAQPALAMACEQLGLPGPSRRIVDITVPKLAFRGFQKTEGFPHPQYFEAVELSNHPPVRGPWVAKPNQSSGSRGVQIFSNWQKAEGFLQKAAEESLDGLALVEQALEGFPCTVEGILRQGKIIWSMISERQTADESNPATMGHYFPSGLPRFQEERVARLLNDYWQRLGLTDGIFDADLILGKGDDFVLECSPRQGGNNLTPMIRLLGGPDLSLTAIAQATGNPIPALPRRPMKPGFLRLLGSEKHGILQYRPEAIASLRDRPEVLSLEVDSPPGSPVKPFINGRCRLGCLIGLAEDRKEADQLLHSCLQALNWKIE